MTDTKLLRSVGGANVPLTPAESWDAQKRLADAQLDRDTLNDAAKWWMRECEEAKAERNQLRAINAELVKALKATLKVLDTMTSDDFAHGADKPVREQARDALAKVRLIADPHVPYAGDGWGQEVDAILEAKAKGE